ncbi:MAG TPA: YceI family protein [Verrucomicrobiae bacterium]|nr:YceI family protein [Verrucomicrobiae bacterium]
MKNLTLRLFAVAIGCSMLAATNSNAEDFVRYRARPRGAKVHLDGSANIHDWTMDGTIIGGWFEVPANVTIDSSQAAIGGMSGDKLNAKAEANIPVVTLQSGTSGMDQVMQQAMNATDHPQIAFKLSEMTLKQPHSAGTPFQFDTKGDLTVNGVTKPITMPVSIETIDKTKLKISGGPVEINMTDYKVPPPTKFGIFETRPNVKITLQWVVALPKTSK